MHWIQFKVKSTHRRRRLLRGYCIYHTMMNLGTILEHSDWKNTNQQQHILYLIDVLATYLYLNAGTKVAKDFHNACKRKIFIELTRDGLGNLLSDEAQEKDAKQYLQVLVSLLWLTKKGKVVQHECKLGVIYLVSSFPLDGFIFHNFLHFMLCFYLS